MANPIYVMQNSFTGGEFSPVMDARQDLQKYSSGSKKMLNFYSLPHGAAVNRPGTRFIAETKNSANKSRLIPFQFSTEQAYAIEFGDLYCRFYRDGGQVVSGGSPYDIVTPYLVADLPLLNFTQSADVLYIVHPKYTPKVLTRTSDTNWTLTDFAYHDGPFMPVNLVEATTVSSSAVTGTVTLTATAAVFNTSQVGSLFKLEHDIEEQSISVTLTAAGSTASIKGKGDWNLITHGTWTGKLKLEKSEDNGTTWEILRSYGGAGDYNPIASGTESDELVLLRITANTGFSGSARIDLNFYPFTVQGIAKITAVTDSTHATATVLNEFGSTAATDIWYEGAWSSYRGFPAAVVFFQNRLIFGNTTAQPQTLWSSKTGDYINFGISSPIVDDDSITTSLVSEQVNSIRSLKALDKIIGFTSGGTWKIGPGGDSAAFTPTGQPAKQQGFYGASTLAPLTIGNRMLYSQNLGSGIRDIGYDFASDSYTGTDLTLLAEHLFRSRTITQWAYQQEPNGIVWCVCNDGQLLGFTYLREQDVWGWHRHETDGTFDSVVTIPGDDGDEVWFIVKRTIGGVTKRYVEQLAARTYSTSVSDQYFVDCGLSYNGTATATFTGLNHLEGKTVAILADGNVMPRKVVASGSVTIDNTASVVHIGLPYTCDLQTLNVEFQGNDGTIQTRYKNITKATLRLEKTRETFIGTTFDEMYEIKLREDENYDQATQMFTGDQEMNCIGGSSKEAQICVRVSNPVPITVLAIVAEVALDG